ncbi:hypothetical protein BGW38_003415, partial [Lunasporangiospora selenospora]
MSKDMKNVNNWHWVDKNCLAWAKTYFEDSLSNVSTESAGTTVKILAVSSVTGDVDVNQRKGKIITIFDVVIDLTFEGTTADGTEVTGKINIPEVAHDTDSDDYVFDVTIDSDSSAKQPVRDLIRKGLAPLLRKKLALFAGDLIRVHGKDVQVDSDFSKPSTPVPATPPTSTTPVPGAKSPAASSSVTSGNVNTTSWDESVEMQASAHDVYDAKASVWTRSNRAMIEAKVGGKFSFFDGSVTGEITELEEDKKIVQKWRLNSWPAGHFSKVTMEFDQGANSTTIKFKQEGVPVGELDITRRNWSNYYWAEIKRTFGYVGFHSSTSTRVSSSSSTITSSSSSSLSTEKRKRRRRREAKKGGSGSGSAGSVGMYTGTGLV